MKYVYEEQRLPGTMGSWAEPFTMLRLQKQTLERIKAGRAPREAFPGLPAPATK